MAHGSSRPSRTCWLTWQAIQFGFKIKKQWQSHVVLPKGYLIQFGCNRRPVTPVVGRSAAVTVRSLNHLMWKKLLTLLISLAICVAIFWRLAPYILSGRFDSLPSYGHVIAYDPTRPGGHLRPNKNLLVRSDRYGHGVRWVTNSQGYRNEHEITPWPAAGTLRILFYGDSFVDGMRTGQNNTIGAVLERELERRLDQPVEVVISGHNNPANTWYHWQTFGRYIHPHFVILGLTLGNDISTHNFGAGVLPTLECMDNLVSLDPTSSQADVSNAQVMIPAGGFLPEDQRSRSKVLSATLIRRLGHLIYPLARKVPPALWPVRGEPGQARAAGFCAQSRSSSTVRGRVGTWSVEPIRGTRNSRPLG